MRHNFNSRLDYHNNNRTVQSATDDINRRNCIFLLNKKFQECEMKILERNPREFITKIEIDETKLRTRSK